MLCAAWELYVEQILLEGANVFTEKFAMPDGLPAKVKGKISQAAKKDNHDHGVLKLCGEGWKDVYKTALVAEVNKLNTPKHGPVSELFMDWLGWEDFSSKWRHDRARLNEFVTLRGEIAHRGADARYIRVSELRDMKALIDEIVVDTDRGLAEHLKGLLPGRRLPWHK